MSFSAFAVFVAVYALAVATPGPGIAAIVARTLGRGRQGTVPFILGFVMGDLVWFIATTLGLSLIVKAYAPLFELIRYLGCAYLLFVAWSLWRQEPLLPEAGVNSPQERFGAAFSGSFFLTLGNPKVMIFFLSIMPLVVTPEEISWLVGLELAATIVVVISAILFSYVLLADRARRLFRSQRKVAILQKSNAGVLAGAAVAIATR
jgi:threonine/homoserine/homoserine lactone efflux protein